MHIFGQVCSAFSKIGRCSCYSKSKEADHDMDEELFPAHSRCVSIQLL